MRRELQAGCRSDPALPEILGARCVHALMETASCRACVDACPRDAWIIDDDMLGIDTDRCDGCDLCVPVCPQGAIQGRFSAFVEVTDQSGAAFAACGHAGVSAGKDGLMPCLHALGLSDLLQLHRDGVGFLISSRGDCERCERGRAKRLEERLDEANRLLQSRGLRPLKHRDLAADAWDKAFRRMRERAASRPLDRRAFFRTAIKLPKERLEAAIEDAIGSFVPPGMMLPEGDAADPLLPWVPRIDPGLCTGCDACVRLCPQQAIELHAREASEPWYLIRPQRCSACGICKDVCEHHAITIDALARGRETRVPLKQRRCPVCGADFHVSVAGAGTDSRCWVCRRTNHHGNLYQVLD